MPPRVPRFVRDHRFALPSRRTSPALLLIQRCARTALSTAAAHGAAVAIAAALLQRACRLGEAAGAAGVAPSARAFLVRLRAALRAVVERGAAANARWRLGLRNAVARVVFRAEEEEGRTFRRRLEELRGIVDGESRALFGDARRLRSVVLAVREAVGAAVEADEEEHLRWEVWGEVDGLLAAAVEARDDERDGGVDQACAAVGYQTEILLRSAKVAVFVGDQTAVDVDGAVERCATSREVVVRGDARVCANLRVRTTGDGGLAVASELWNVGGEDVYVLGVSLSVAPPGVLLPIYAKLPVTLPKTGKQAAPASLLYETVVSVQSGDEQLQVVWDVHSSLSVGAVQTK